jgi:hypothetical protein
MIVTLARWDFILQGCQLDLVILSGLAIVFIKRAIKKTVTQAFLSLTSGFDSALASCHSRFIVYLAHRSHHAQFTAGLHYHWSALGFVVMSANRFGTEFERYYPMRTMLLSPVVCGHVLGLKARAERSF